MAVGNNVWETDKSRKAGTRKQDRGPHKVAHNRKQEYDIASSMGLFTWNWTLYVVVVGHSQ